MRHTDSKKKEVEIYYKTNKATAIQTAKRFDIPYTTIKDWIRKDGWDAGIAIEEIDTTKNEVVTNNFNVIATEAKKSIKEEITRNLGTLGSQVDKIVLDSLLEESSNNILLQAMTLNHINKTLALNASIAKNALLSLNARDDDSAQSKMAIIACSEKVSKIFTELKTSLFGKEITFANLEQKDLSELSEAELIEIINKEDEC